MKFMNYMDWSVHCHNVTITIHSRNQSYKFSNRPTIDIVTFPNLVRLQKFVTYREVVGLSLPYINLAQQWHYHFLLLGALYERVESLWKFVICLLSIALCMTINLYESISISCNWTRKIVQHSMIFYHLRLSYS